MSDNKKYYYLKLKENFFDREEIKVIKGMNKGDTYICIMLEMYLRSLKRDGALMMTDRIPFKLETLSSVLNRPIDEVKYAIELFQEFQLVDILDSGAIFMSDIQNFIGRSSSEGDRKREYRAKIEDHKEGNIPKLGHLSDNRPPELELELELERELEIIPPNPQGEKEKTISLNGITISNQVLSKHGERNAYLVSQIVAYWNSKRPKTECSEIDTALFRHLNEILKENNFESIKQTIDKLSTAIDDSQFFYSRELSLFDFSQKAEFTSWKHKNLESLKTFTQSQPKKMSYVEKQALTQFTAPEDKKPKLSKLIWRPNNG